MSKRIVKVMFGQNGRAIRGTDGRMFHPVNEQTAKLLGYTIGYIAVVKP